MEAAGTVTACTSCRRARRSARSRWVSLERMPTVSGRCPVFSSMRAMLKRIFCLVFSACSSSHSRSGSIPMAVSPLYMHWASLMRSVVALPPERMQITSSWDTGVLNSANLAKETMLEKYPDRKIYIVDSLAASSGYGFLMDKLADLRDGGMNIDELYAWVEENKLNLQIWFFTSDLTFFVKGGRVSKTSGFVGNMLSICPLLNMDVDGKLIPRYKIRTKRKVIEAIVNKMEEFAEERLEYSGKCYLSHSACYEDARAVADLIEERFPKLQEKVQIYDVGTTIGSHTGPGTVALFYWGDKRID